MQISLFAKLNEKRIYMTRILTKTFIKDIFLKKLNNVLIHYIIIA